MIKNEEKMYKSEKVIKHYNEFGEKEWDRLSGTATGRLKFFLHMEFIREFIKKEMKVLDVGCGAGRFSAEFAKMGAAVTLADISPGQIDIAKKKFSENNLLADDFIVTDLKNMSFENSSFDIVVCYGAALNYLLESTEQGISELVRVLKPGGMIFISVVSRWGVQPILFSSMLKDNLAEFLSDPEKNQIYRSVENGDLIQDERITHPTRHFFDSKEIKILFENAGIEKIGFGCAPCIASNRYEAVEEVSESQKAWETLLYMEKKAFMQPGLVDCGEFLMMRGMKK